MTGLMQDVRYTLRQLRKNPAFTAVAVFTLALGIGANTAIFSVIEAVILRPLPFATPDRLVWLNGKIPMTDEAAVSPPDFRDYRTQNRAFDCIVAMGYSAGPSNLSGAKPEQVLTTVASANFFDCLGIHPLLGRDFLFSDEQVNEAQVAVLGYGIWRRDFGSDRNVVGRTIRMDSRTLTVIGVLPSDIPLLSEAQIWLPTPMLNRLMSFRLGHSLKAIGRLKPGVTLHQSQADLNAIALQLQNQYPDTNKDWWMRQRLLRDVLIGPVRTALLMMWGAVGVLSLIACVNVANLLLARSVSRHREFALRTALGASAARMIRQTLTESVVLSLIGASLGLIAAAWGIHVVHAFGTLSIPRLDETRVNPAVLGLTAGVSMFTGVLFGLFPALQISGHQFDKGLTESGRTSAPKSHRRFSSALVIGEVAMSLMLLVSAGLLLKSFWRLIHVNPGFQPDHIVAARLSLPLSRYERYGAPGARVQFWRQFEERVKALPGVEAVGATSELPLTGQHSDDPFHIPGRTYGPSEFDDAQFRQVTPGYLSAMGIPLLSGRLLNDHDDENSPAVVVINEAFAKRFFPGDDVIGMRLQLMGDASPTREIVGIVGDIRHIALSEPSRAEMYVPYAQFAPPTMNLVVRAAANPLNLGAALQVQVGAVDKDITLSAVVPMDDILEASVSQPRFSSELIGMFAVLALLLAVIGLYGLLTYSVTQRRTEIGIRMALGATREDILRLVLRRGSALAFTGAAIGLLSSIAASRLLSSMLFAVSPKDPETFFAVAVLLVSVALVACYVPARRAAKVEPMVALRYQ